MEQSILRFNRQRRDPISAVYHPGNGYRAYYPQLMCFSCPDSFSPFAAGGFNSYSYCAGDPINRADPSGHFSWQAGLGIGLSVFGIFAALWSGGASLVAAGSLSAALDSAGTLPLLTGAANLLADISGLGSALTQNAHLSSTLGWLSFAAGVVSLAAGINLLLSDATAALRQRLGNIRRIGLSGGAEAAGREMAAERQILSREQRMALLDDPTMITHTLDRYNPHLITSSGYLDYARVENRHHAVTWFEAEYHPDRWIIYNMTRVKSDRFFADDLIAWQYQKIARKQGFYGIFPDRIEQHNVDNALTIDLTVDKQGDALRDTFLTQTPNGKLMQRLADLGHSSVSRVEAGGYNGNFISHFENGL